MPSVFVLDGTNMPLKKNKRTRKALDGAAPVVGDCKTVKNPRTGCEMQLCYVGARTRNGKKSRTGWEFQEGSSRCPTRR